MQEERNDLKMELLIKGKGELKDLELSQPVLMENNDSLSRTERGELTEPLTW